jgi:hypothetical protein
MSTGFFLKTADNSSRYLMAQNNVFDISLCNRAEEETEEKHANCLETFTKDVTGLPGARVSTN